MPILTVIVAALLLVIACLTLHGVLLGIAIGVCCAFIGTIIGMYIYAILIVGAFFK